MATTTVLLLASVCLAYTVTGEFIKILRKPVNIRFQLPSYKKRCERLLVSAIIYIRQRPMIHVRLPPFHSVFELRCSLLFSTSNGFNENSLDGKTVTQQSKI